MTPTLALSYLAVLTLGVMIGLLIEGYRGLCRTRRYVALLDQLVEVTRKALAAEELREGLQKGMESR